MKTIFCSFDYVFIKLQLDTTLESNVIHSLKDDDLILFVFDSDVDVSEFHKQEEILMNSVNVQYIKASDYSIQREHYDSDESYQTKLESVKVSLIDDIKRFEADSSVYTVYQMK